MAPGKIIVNTSRMERGIPQKILDNYNRSWPRKLLTTLPEIKSAAMGRLLLSETYYSLVGGTLKAEFGLGEEAADEVQNLMDIIVNSIQISFTPMKYSFPKKAPVLGGGVSVFINSSVYDELYSTSYIAQPSGTEITWVEWLLNRGDQIIIKGYDVLFTQAAINSRSGEAVMVETQHESYKVSGKYSGTSQNNWITRTLGNDSEFGVIVSSIMFNRLF